MSVVDLHGRPWHAPEAAEAKSLERSRAAGYRQGVADGALVVSVAVLIAVFLLLLVRG